jgi:hypothetical protein
MVISIAVLFGDILKDTADLTDVTCAGGYLDLWLVAALLAARSR